MDCQQAGSGWCNEVNDFLEFMVFRISYTKFNTNTIKNFAA